MSSQTKLEQVLNKLSDIEKAVSENHKLVKLEIQKDGEIDDVSLDSASLATAKLQSRYGTWYTDEYLQLSDLKVTQKRYKLERWKYYAGKQTNKYYADYGPMHEEVIKSDIDKYLDADPIMIAVNKIVDIQTMIVTMLDKFAKDLNGRNYQIRTALDYRKFVSGV